MKTEVYFENNNTFDPLQMLPYKLTKREYHLQKL